MNQSLKITLLSIVALSVWVYNLGLFQKNKGPEIKQVSNQDWDLNLEERLKILAEQNIQPLEDISFDPFNPTFKPKPQPKPEPQKPVVPPPKPKPIFEGQYAGQVRGEARETFMFQWFGEWKYIQSGDKLGEWELTKVGLEKLTFTQGEFSHEVER